MAVDVRLFTVPFLFLRLTVIVAVSERAVIVLVRMPVRAVFPLAQWVIRVVV